MTNSTSDHEPAVQEQLDPIKGFAKALKEAREAHRQIVPIVGAGLSADSGFPVIEAIVRYFGKLYRYIEQQGPLRRTRVPEIKYLEDRLKEYKEKPWRLVEDFGWPDRFQLNQDLYASLREVSSKQTSDKIVEEAERDGLDRVLRLGDQSGWRAYDDLRKTINAKLDEANGVIAKLEEAKGEKLEEAKGDLRGPKKADAIAALDQVRDRLEKNRSRSSAFDIVGDWRRLILFFTNYRSDYADALFARFASARQPGQGHRFLAFLIRHLAVPTVFTFNFDSLIEQAFESDGARPRVFAMERGAGLPHASLVRNHLSVIKMHGSTHALLLDEQLDRPLSEEYLQRFSQITGANPLLLIVGCSENDQRLRDLVSDVVVNRSSPDTPCVLWLHYEDKSPDFLDKLPSKDGAATQGKILTCPTNNPGATLQHLYSWLTGCHPAGNLPYLAHVQQPVHRGKKVNKQGTRKPGPKKKPFELISSLARQNPIPSASHELLKRANHWTRNGYHFIWIDLEAVHTFAGVVGAIIDQCRKYDPDLAPSVLPVDIDGLSDEGKDQTFLIKTIDLAVNRVARALRRTRYYLALDGLETYVWPATTHHGLSHMAMQNEGNARLKNLGEFLKRLLEEGEDLGESLVGISVDNPISRHDSKLSKHLRLREVVDDLEEVSHGNTYRRHAFEFNLDDHFEYLADDLPLVSLKMLPDGVISGADDERRKRLALILFNLSCFRRIRPLVAVRHLIEPLLHDDDGGGDDAVETILVRFVDAWHGYVLQQLEGGGFWFTRTIRNKVYAENTKYTDTDEIRICLTGRNQRNKTVSLAERRNLCRNSAFQLCLAAMTHQRIARTWYTRTFVQSQDTFSFLEYTYHRISTVRSLVKLRRLVQVASKEKIIADAVREGIQNFVDLNKPVDWQANSKQPEFENDDFIRELLVSPASRRYGAIRRLTEIEPVLKKRHLDELGSLYRAWTRSEVLLRTQVPAEQLLHWCKELLTDDLRHRCNRVVIGYRKRRASKKQLRYKLQYHKLPRKDRGPDDLIDQNIEDGVIREFRQYLQDLQAKIWIERSDYETCIGARWRHLLDADVRMGRKMTRKYHLSREGPVEPRKWKALERDDSFIASCDEAQCHRLLDIANCKLQWELETSSSDSEIKRKRKAPRRLLKRVRDRLEAIETNKKRPAIPADVNNLNEAWLRLLHLEAENQMGRITIFTHDGFTADPKNWTPESLELDEVRQTISDGLKRIKTHDARTHQAPRSVLLDPTTDGALYLQYRSVFYMLKGRTEWLSSDKGFDKAQWCFEMARGGLGNNSPLMTALIELYAVEALLAGARKELRIAASDEDAVAACDRARGLYDSARGGLQRARESLLASRRNVIWRKFYFRLTTQYHSDRQLLGYALLKSLVEKLNAPKISEEDKAKHRQSCGELLRHFLLRLRRAYQSLLTAVDLYLPQSFDHQNPDRCPNRFRWLYRMWWELTLCGYATGRLALSLDSKTESDEADTFVTGQLQWLNETDGIEASELGKLIKGKFERLRRLYEENVETSSNSQGAQRALEDRHALIRLAMEAAHSDDGQAV